VEPAAAPLLESHPALNEVFFYQRRQGLQAFLPFLRSIRQQRFDLVLDLQRHAKSGLVSRFSGAPVRVGFHHTNTKEGNWLFNTHTIEPVAEFSLKLRQYLKFADALGLPDDGIHFDLRVRKDEEEKVEALLADTPRPFVAYFLGSRWPSRFWFPEATAQVARVFRQEYGMGAVLLGGPGEVSFAQKVSEALGGRVSNLSGKTSLREVIGIFSRATLAIGPDSGPMHIAAATGIPVISLWGATSPVRSAPWGSEPLVIQGQAACSPCYVHRCPIERRCMRTITPEDVLSRARPILNRTDGH
jgi:lipopolysaccharide heptosyltransferase II